MYTKNCLLVFLFACLQTLITQKLKWFACLLTTKLDSYISSSISRLCYEVIGFLSEIMLSAAIGRLQQKGIIP